MEKVITKELATEEVNKWLDYKKISNTKREAAQPLIDVLIESVETGVITISDKQIIKHKLNFPTEGDAPVTELNYKPRLAHRDTIKYLKGVGQDDVDGRLLATMCALTDKPAGVLRALDTTDFSIAQAIAVFFT